MTVGPPIHSILTFPKNRRKVPPLMQDARYLRLIRVDPVENRMGMNEQGAQPRAKLVASASGKAIALQALRRAGYIPHDPVGDFKRGGPRVITPYVPQILLGSRSPDNVSHPCLTPAVFGAGLPDQIVDIERRT